MAVRGALVVATSLVLSLTCLPGAALCVGSNGHLAIEATGSECVTLSTATASSRDLGMLAAGSLHGCTDTPLGAPGLRSSTDRDRAMLCAVARVASLVALDPGATPWPVLTRSAPAVRSWSELSPVLLL